MMQKVIDDIKSTIKKSAEESGRSAEAVTLMAVSKTFSPEHILPAVQCGICDLGENRVQELVEKYDAIPDVRWHLIGHLQKNKVKYIIDKVYMIHSVDSYELALEINKRAEAIGKRQKILVQVSMAGEESKFGISPDLCLNLVNEISQLKFIEVCGIMTIPPIYDDQAMTINLFKNCRLLFEKIRAANIPNTSIQHLSMGMSADYPLAVKEGATMVRIGRSIFGARDYNTVI